MELVILLLAVAAIGLFLIIRQKNKQQAKPEPVVQKKNYSAVRIKPHQHACNAAFEYSHRTYLASEAPLLPLPECNKSESCRCGYIHYNDRRQDYERRGMSIVMRDVYSKKERRDSKVRGRRKDD